ncbi:MAG TPA: helix-turn-helix transcriptional regulator [Candidatus Avimonoglobus intestinipullorum]|uniref:Helix-turn-helix transcriptional regulator n=1 Tax=Candidatus Avimonoglobus intestinipullorum TaxID=2840699 RepID=A0A9D1LUW5_9FIRM|nr:helix-turn-helix transcriptional regulator [Candidatus Avimonoglobus intestinipullorum]
MSIDYSLIGARIQARRKQMHLTQEQLAEALSVSVGYISQVERGTPRRTWRCSLRSPRCCAAT